MSIFNKDSLIPLASLVFGVLLTCAVYKWQKQPQPGVEAAVEKFDNLTESEQTNVRNIAGAHLNDPEYRARMAAVHQAVEKDPALLPKLTALNELLRKQDQRVQKRLMPGGEFAKNWVTQIEQLSRNDVYKVPDIRIPMSRNPDGTFSFLLITNDKVQSFFEAVITEPAPGPLQEKLDGLDKPGQTNERALTKIIWVIEQIHPALQAQGDSDSSAAAAQEISDELVNRLVDKDVAEKMGEWVRFRTRDFSNDPQKKRRAVAILLSTVVFHHYKERFNQVHVRGDRDKKAEFFSDQLDREGQLSVMHLDPAEAESRLDNTIIEQQHVSDPAIGSLSQDIRRIQIKAKLDFHGSSQGPGRGDRRGRGGSGGGGRGGLQGPRPSESGGGPPPGERGRPPARRD